MLTCNKCISTIILFLFLISGAVCIITTSVNSAPPTLSNTEFSNDVDIQLALAVDVSRSMDPDEQRIQRNGYAETIESAAFLRSITGGRHRRIAIAYFEWGGATEQSVVVNWTLIDGPASATQFAKKLREAPISRASRTSISGAIYFAINFFRASPYLGRSVLDLSADGPNNDGGVVTIARDAAIRQNITINGLPIMIMNPSESPVDIEHLDFYFEDCVIGGDSSFMIPITTKEQFQSSIKMKMTSEVAGKVPVSKPKLVHAAAPRISCTIGEQRQRSNPSSQ